MKQYKALIMGFILVMTGLQLIAQDEIVMAITDFQNLTNDPELDYLEIAIPEILITNFSLSESIQIVERSRLQTLYDEMELSLSGTVAESEAVQLGEMVGAQHILLGSLIRTPNLFRIDSRLIKISTGEVIMAEKKEWLSDDDIIQAVDDLAAQIARNLTGEELILAGDSELSEPEFPMDNPLAIETALDNRYRHPEDEGPVHLKIDLYSRQAANDNRIPLNVALVIDCSGSMAAEQKIDFVKEAAEFVVRNLSSQDRLSLVSYQTESQVVIPTQTVTEKNNILDIIRNLGVGGSTNMSEGMLMGYQEVAKNLTTGQVNRILLLSDGLANRGITDPKLLQDLCLDKCNLGISLSSFGVGADYNEDMMLNLAEYGNGNYYFIDSPRKIPTIFSRELQGLLSVTAQNVQLRIRPDAHISVREIYGYRYERVGEDIIISLGDVFSNEHRTILVALKVSPSEDVDASRAAVTVAYHNTEGREQSVSDQVNLTLNYTEDAALIHNHENSGVMQELRLQSMSKQLTQTIQLVDQGQVDKAVQALEKELKNVSASPEKYTSPALKKQVLATHQYKSNLENIREKPDSAIEIMQKGIKYQQYQTQKKKPKREERNTQDSTRIAPPSKPGPIPTPTGVPQRPIMRRKITLPKQSTQEQQEERKREQPAVRDQNASSKRKPKIADKKEEKPAVRRPPKRLPDQKKEIKNTQESKQKDEPKSKPAKKKSDQEQTKSQKSPPEKKRIRIFKKRTEKSPESKKEANPPQKPKRLD